MSKQQITIEVDVPEGREIGEVFTSISGHSFPPLGNPTTTHSITVEFRPAWQWPAWLLANWLAQDPNGIWWAFSDQPIISGNEWVATKFVRLQEQLLDFTPPPCTDWRQSKRRRPGS